MLVIELNLASSFNTTTIKTIQMASDYFQLENELKQLSLFWFKTNQLQFCTK